MEKAVLQSDLCSHIASERRTRIGPFTSRSARSEIQSVAYLPREKFQQT
ncbi:hypothetical protein JI435_410680 [Parastagonospora nodorum SN15]|uniref:Uncharacterized protein n=1 Tax=Phaeosphaeria nodorum (strain SN15 / ATCC MYA-4574 / FGSC 10173) TaxID=321614 RepID=A0A7U2I0L5_PHANO|nr:hypothetical protein JI435_410680 [Parastagonospora nodorum SN15]